MTDAEKIRDIAKGPRAIQGMPSTHGLKKELILDIRKDVKDEHRNIDIVLNTALSAFTDNPINLAVIAKSSEGKTYLVTKALERFPKEYVIMLRKASPKVFTRERGLCRDHPYCHFLSLYC